MICVAYYVALIAIKSVAPKAINDRCQKWNPMLIYQEPDTTYGILDFEILIHQARGY